ncbi:MAG TPA: hypothetical protein DDZ80_28390 [Cyanobacteria bacterium UBA8803]|nr:hypothetical protein [Cyanobacteria bacterium UBA8803]
MVPTLISIIQAAELDSWFNFQTFPFSIYNNRVFMSSIKVKPSLLLTCMNIKVFFIIVIRIIYKLWVAQLPYIGST